VIETVAIWPTLTLEMSSSLIETLIVMVLSLTSSAKPELELEPVLPVLPVPVLLVLALADAAVDESLPLETVWPTESLASEAITPVAGA
jgi:hypothetical protein